MRQSFKAHDSLVSQEEALQINRAQVTQVFGNPVLAHLPRRRGTILIERKYFKRWLVGAGLLAFVISLGLGLAVAGYGALWAALTR